MTLDEIRAAFKALPPLPYDRLERERMIFGPRWAARRDMQRLVGEHYRKRPWRERLLSWPWRPWRAWEAIKQWTPEEIARMKARAVELREAE